MAAARCNRAHASQRRRIISAGSGPGSGRLAVVLSGGGRMLSGGGRMVRAAPMTGTATAVTIGGMLYVIYREGYPIRSALSLSRPPGSSQGCVRLTSSYFFFTLSKSKPPSDAARTCAPERARGDRNKKFTISYPQPCNGLSHAGSRSAKKCKPKQAALLLDIEIIP